MHPRKVNRDQLQRLEDLPNVGKASAEDYRLLGLHTPDQVRGQDPWELYEALCTATGARQDPCVLDLFISVARFLEGEEPRPWWDYTAERKRAWAQRKSEAADGL